jgi:hypothetical protein
MVGSNSNQGDFSMPVVRLVRSAFLGAAVVGSLLVSAPLAMSAVYSPQQALPAATIQSFLANPEGLLSQYPDGGALMISRVKDLVASDPATVNPILALLRTANPEQASAIGTALGQVALMAVAKDQAFATDLQTKVAQTGNTSAIVAFSAVVGGDIKLAATGPGAGAGGGGESQTGGNTGLVGFAVNSPFSLTTSVRNVPDSFTSPSFSTGGAGSSFSSNVSPSSP